MKVCPVCQYEEEQDNEVVCVICGSDLDSSIENIPEVEEKTIENTDLKKIEEWLISEAADKTVSSETEDSKISKKNLFDETLKTSEMNENASLLEIIGLPILIFLVFSVIFTGINIPGYFDPYCADADNIEGEPTFSASSDVIRISKFEYFACELGIVKGSVDLSWYISLTDINAVIYPTELSIIILDHEQYSNFIAGYNYGITNTQMHELQLESKLSPNQFDIQNPRNLYESVYNIDMTENSYYLIIHWEYRTTFGSEDMQELTDYRRESLDFENTHITFYYAVDLDYVPNK